MQRHSVPCDVSCGSWLLTCRFVIRSQAALWDRFEGIDERAIKKRNNVKKEGMGKKAPGRPITHTEPTRTTIHIY